MELTTGALEGQQWDDPQNMTGFACGGHFKFLPLDLFDWFSTSVGFN